MGFRQLYYILFVITLVVYSPLSLAMDELALNSVPTKKTLKRTPAATKKSPLPPKKKNLKKGKNVDTNAKKKPLTKSKPRPSLPTQTRAEMLAKSAADAKAQEEAKAKLQSSLPAGAPAVSTAQNSGEVDVNQPIDESTSTGEQSLDQPIDEEITAGGEDVALDLGASEPEKWNPYSFGRSSFWILLPFLTLAFLGLHLLPVPKRRYVKRLSAVPDFLKLKDKPTAPIAAAQKTRGHADG